MPNYLFQILSCNNFASDKQVNLSFDRDLLSTMVFQKAITCLQSLASTKAKNALKKGDISTETQTAREKYERIQFNLDAERATGQQVKSSKQRQSKKTFFSRIQGGN